jgi:ankyrin repeat protein
MYQARAISGNFIWPTSENAIKTLIENGVDPNKFDENQQTALMISSALGFLDLVKVFAEKGVDFNLKNISGRCALHSASLTGQNEICQFLIQKGCELNLSDSDAMTALHFASENGHQQTVKMLIANQANINAIDAHGNTALHFASQNGHQEVAEYLIQKGLSVNKGGKFQMTAFHLASYYGHDELVEFLKEIGAEIGLKDEDGNTAFHLACKQGHMNVVKFLFSKGASIHEKVDSTMDSALHLACRFGHNEVVNFLFCNGADLNTKNVDGKTALFIACEYGRISVARFLIEKGARVDLKCNKNCSIRQISLKQKDSRLCHVIETLVLQKLYKMFKCSNPTELSNRVLEWIDNEDVSVINDLHNEIFELPNEQIVGSHQILDYFSSFEFKEKFLEDVMNCLKTQKELLNIGLLKLKHYHTETTTDGIADCADQAEFIINFKFNQLKECISGSGLIELIEADKNEATKTERMRLINSTIRKLIDTIENKIKITELFFSKVNQLTRMK